MAISVKYFASLRERLGRAQDSVAAQGVATVADVWSQCGDGKPLSSHLLISVNMEYARADQAVKDGDEVAFFPPVTGG